MDFNVSILLEVSKLIIMDNFQIKKIELTNTENNLLSFG